ncbi:MAG: ABC transporter permease DevC [Myxococcota bacterium]
MGIALGWMQLKHQKVRLLVAISGIAFAVILILMQLGFRSSLLDSSVRYLEALRYDIALINNDTLYLAQTSPFSARRLYQGLGVEGVRDVSPVYAAVAVWKNPFDHQSRNILVLGVDPADRALEAPGVAENLERVRKRDVVLFDALSRPEHGPVPEAFRAGRRIVTEVNEREIEVEGLFEVGTSFGIDGGLLTSDDNFLRLFPDRRRTQIDLGLVSLERGASPQAVRDALRAIVPNDVLVLTRTEILQRERAYWMATTPIGTVFTFGVVIGFVVGAIIVYQILFADVSDHLPEYATLKAMGYSNGYVSWVVIQQAVILAALGFVPGVAVCWWLYGVVGEATMLPMTLGWERGATVLGLTMVMCAISGMLALRKVRSLDPADVF